MSAYDTVDRLDDLDVTVKFYCEVPMDPMDPMGAVMLQAGRSVIYLNAGDAIRLATALLNAAQRVRHATEVDAVVAGRRR